MTFIPHHEIIRAKDASPSQYFYVLHGVYGSSANWRLFMRKLVSACPDWGAILVDVRGHARSYGAPPPHTVEAVAEDLLALESQLQLPIRAAVGHSLGGKLVMTYAEQRRDPLRQVWVLDSRFSPLDASYAVATQVVLRILNDIPSTFPSRDAFTEAVQAKGLEKPIAQWLAMNVRRHEDSYKLMLDLPAIKALLDSYYAADLSPALERANQQRDIHLVVGTRSYVWDAALLQRLDAAAANNPHLTIHRVDAGHWVHVDAGPALLEMMIKSFSNQ